MGELLKVSPPVAVSFSPPAYRSGHIYVHVLSLAVIMNSFTSDNYLFKSNMLCIVYPPDLRTS